MKTHLITLFGTRKGYVRGSTPRKIMDRLARENAAIKDLFSIEEIYPIFPPGLPPKINITEAMKMRRQGCTYQQIADELNVTKQAVYLRLKKEKDASLRKK